MRMLEKNKRDIWYSYFMGSEEVIIDGLYTGEMEEKYTNTFKTKVNFMPKSSVIRQDNFGELEDIDLVIMTDKDIFNEDTVIFIHPPTNIKVADSYDYKVSKIIKTLNSYTIGLTKVVR